MLAGIALLAILTVYSQPTTTSVRTCTTILTQKVVTVKIIWNIFYYNISIIIHLQSYAALKARSHSMLKGCGYCYMYWYVYQ